MISQIFSEIAQKESYNPILRHKTSGITTYSSDDWDSVYLDSSPPLDNVWAYNTGCHPPVLPICTHGLESILMKNYCLCDLKSLPSLVPNKMPTNQINFSNNIVTTVNDFSNQGENHLFRPAPIINDVSLMLNKLNKVKEWGPASNMTSDVPQHIHEKLVHSQQDLGDLPTQSDKNSYVKAVFHITRIDRETQEKRRLNKHRHVISHWEHVGAQYYARGMWKKWYFSKGQRKKNAEKCEHTNRSHYAIGLCKLCYLKHYHKMNDRKKKTDD